MTNTKDETRELVICALYSGGETMEEIGQRYEVSRERIRQILLRNGLGGQNQNTRIDPFKVLRMVGESSSASEVARKMGLSMPGVLRVFRELAPLAIAEMAAYRHERTREHLIRRLQSLAARLGKTPGKKDLDRHGPATNSLQYVFGSLKKGQVAAGLPPNKTGRPFKVAA